MHCDEHKPQARLCDSMVLAPRMDWSVTDLAGEEGLCIFNSWTSLSDADKKDTEKIWKKFEEHLQPKSNFRLACLYL